MFSLLLIISCLTAGIQCYNEKDGTISYNINCSAPAPRKSSKTDYFIRKIAFGALTMDMRIHEATAICLSGERNFEIPSDFLIISEFESWFKETIDNCARSSCLTVEGDSCFDALEGAISKMEYYVDELGKAYEDYDRQFNETCQRSPTYENLKK